MKANHKFIQIKEIQVSKIVLGENNVKEGEVISCGKESKDIKKGDKVVFDTNKSIKHIIRGQEYWFCNFETILCIL